MACRGREMSAEPATSNRAHVPGLRVGSWTTWSAGRYPFRMGSSLVLRSSSRLSWRTARRLAASWFLAATVSVPVPVAVADTGVWRTDAGETVVGRNQVYIARYEDTLLDVARRFGMGLAELRLANPGVDIWLPGRGTAIRLPSRFILPEAPRSGLVINVAEMRVYYYPKGAPVVRTWPISIGRVGWETPLGETSIVRKKARPIWYPPDSIREESARSGRTLPRAVGPGPDNPLGSHALYLGFPQYLIHGTNKPFSIGMRVSHGCVRMYPEHIVELFELVEPGTPVTLVHQGVKAGWAGGRAVYRSAPERRGPGRGDTSEHDRCGVVADCGDFGSRRDTRDPGLETDRGSPRHRKRNPRCGGETISSAGGRPERIRGLTGRDKR